MGRAGGRASSGGAAAPRSAPRREPLRRELDQLRSLEEALEEDDLAGEPRFPQPHAPSISAWRNRPLPEAPSPRARCRALPVRLHHRQHARVGRVPLRHRVVVSERGERTCGSDGADMGPSVPGRRGISSGRAGVVLEARVAAEEGELHGADGAFRCLRHDLRRCPCRANPRCRPRRGR